jgi:hypothetical protein
MVLPALFRGSRLAAMLPLAVLAIATSACLGYPAEGTVATPPPPGSDSGQSRLPELLGQLQGGSAGLSLFDGSTNDVLAETDATPSGKDGEIATPTQAVAGANTPGASTNTPTPTPGSIGLQPGTVTPIPTPTPEPSVTPSQTATPAPTATLTPTATPTSGPPAEGSPPSEGNGGGGGQQPPTEG